MERDKSRSEARGAGCSQGQYMIFFCSAGNKTSSETSQKPPARKFWKLVDRLFIILAMIIVAGLFSIPTIYYYTSAGSQNEVSDCK